MNDVKIESVILHQLAINEKFARKVIPYLKNDYFLESSESLVFSKLSDFFLKYNNLPSREAIVIMLNEDKDVSQNDFKECLAYLDKYVFIQNGHADERWLVDEAEKFCQEKAIYNALLSSIKIADGSAKEGKGEIPKILTDALAVSFDPRVGHDFLNDADQRYQKYQNKEDKIPFDIDYLNKITGGGLPNKTLTIIMGGVNVGKSLVLCHFAASYLSAGLNVLYITLEMSEDQVSKRIDANLLDVPVNSLKELSESEYKRKVANLRSKTVGKLIIKEYPTASANCNHFRHLLDELDVKLQFKPAIILIDYMNIASSTRVKSGNDSLYNYVKAIAEEIRGLAVERNLPIVSATQFNRSGFSSSDPSMTDTAESFGSPMTADILLALISNEELDKQGQILFKQLKNRDNDVGYYRRFLVGIDKPKMRLYNLEESAQTEIYGRSDNEEDDTPAFDKTKFGNGMKAEKKRFDFKDVKF